MLLKFIAQLSTNSAVVIIFFSLKASAGFCVSGIRELLFPFCINFQPDLDSSPLIILRIQHLGANDMPCQSNPVFKVYNCSFSRLVSRLCPLCRHLIITPLSLQDSRSGAAERSSAPRMSLRQPHYPLYHG